MVEPKKSPSRRRISNMTVPKEKTIIFISLAVRALGKKHVYPVLLPYGTLSAEGTKDAWLVITALGIPAKQVHTIDIQPFVDPIIAYDSSMDSVNRGNVMARMRMMFLYDL